MSWQSISGQLRPITTCPDHSDAGRGSWPHSREHEAEIVFSDEDAHRHSSIASSPARAKHARQPLVRGACFSLEVVATAGEAQTRHQQVADDDTTCVLEMGAPYSSRNLNQHNAAPAGRASTAVSATGTPRQQRGRVVDRGCVCGLHPVLQPGSAPGNRHGCPARGVPDTAQKRRQELQHRAPVPTHQEARQQGAQDMGRAGAEAGR